MLKALIVALLYLSVPAQPAVAFSHGFPTNPTTLFPTVTFKNIKTDYGASCNGTGTGDAAAFASWIAYGVSQGTTQVGLIIPSGSNCIGCTHVWDGIQGSVGIQNAVIWAFGATCTSVAGEWVGGAGFYADTTHSSLIQTASLNDSSVTLVTASEASRYAVGDWLLIGALELQEIGGGNGFPPNFQFYQFVQVTAKNSGVISILPSVNSSSFKSTYPSVSPNNFMPNDGPATIFKMQPSWNTDLQVFGLTTVISGPIGSSQDIIEGRTVTCTYCTFGGNNVAPTVARSITLLYSTTGAQEVDKDIETYTFSYSTISGSHNMLFQSPAPQNMVVLNSTITGVLNGWPLSGTFTNSTFGSGTNVGSNGYGARNSITFTNTPITSATLLQHYVTRTWLTYNGDSTFSILKSDPNYYHVVAWAVPGFKYAFAGPTGQLTSSPVTYFTINNVTDQGTTIKIWTDLPTTLPTPLCSGVACASFQGYAAATVTQTNSGPVDVTQYGAP